MDLYFKEICVTGDGRKDSVIILKKGINVVYGPSNTGKTYFAKCIDFLFGAKSNPFESELGYSHVRGIVAFDKKDIVLDRDFDSSKIEVSGDYQEYNGMYSISHGARKSISKLWLTLIGIDKDVKLIKNEARGRESLTWRRLVLHSFYDHNTLLSNDSILTGDDYLTRTINLSVMWYLFAGDAFEDLNISTSKDKFAIQKEANLRRIKADKDFLNELSGNYSLSDSPDKIKHEIDDLRKEISALESELTEAASNMQELNKDIQETSEKLARCEILVDRYESLDSQYDSDIARLSFIIDGDLNYKESLPESVCPYCHGPLGKTCKPDYFNAAKAEYRSIYSQKEDLKSALSDIVQEKLSFEKHLDLLLKQKDKQKALMAQDIDSKNRTLQSLLAQYAEAIKNKSSSELINQLILKKDSDYTDECNKTITLNEAFKIKDQIDESFLAELSNEVIELLVTCGFDKDNKVYIDRKDMDLVVNGKAKRFNGTGYCSLYNSILAISLAVYINREGKYPTKFLLLDNPVLSFKENPEGEDSLSKIKGFFRGVMNIPDDIQTILIENEVSEELLSSNVNIIHFTQDSSEGRYGFLESITETIK